jgi:hypothetical protein
MPGRSDPVKALENAYRQAEQQAQQSAAGLVRAGPEAAKRDDAKTAPLRRHVEAAFDARQNLQRAEVAALRERLERIEQSIAARARLKDKIVESRVAELLDPNLQWEPLPPVQRAKASTASSVIAPLPAAEPATQAAGPVAAPPSIYPGTRMPAAAAASNNPVTSTSLPTLRRAPSTASDNTLILRSAEQFSREIGEAADEIERYRSSFGPVHPRRSELTAAERRLKALQAEYAAQLRLLDLELQSAETTLATAQKQLDVAKVLHRQGSVAITEVEKHNLDLERARVRLEQLKTLLDLYRGAVEPAEAQTELRSQTAPVESAPDDKPSALDPAAAPDPDLLRDLSIERQTGIRARMSAMAVRACWGIRDNQT